MVLSDAQFEQAAELTPATVLRYLRSRRWSPAREFGRGQLWELPGDNGSGPPFQVLVPLDQRVRDYASRISDLLETLCQVESRGPAEVLREMSLPSADWQYLRLAPPGPAGTAPLVDVVPALAGLRDLMTAAAAATTAPVPQAVQPAQKPQRVKDYVAAVRLDQTRVGSYVVAAHTPLPPPFEPPGQMLLPVDDSAGRTEPFERLVTRRLYAGIVCAYQAARRTVQTNTLTDFDQYTGAGLSANLCEAMVRIAGEEHQSYQLHFAWSADLPVEHATPPVALNRPLLEALDEGAKDLRARLGRRNAVLRGSVVRLRREASTGPGEITVAGQLVDAYDRRPRRVRMTLDETPYDQAAYAHREGHEVEVRGDLIVQGGKSHLEWITDFAVRPVDD